MDNIRKKKNQKKIKKGFSGGRDGFNESVINLINLFNDDDQINKK